MVRTSPSALLCAVLLATFAGPALANERHFSFTYETAVLPPGALELELWVTPRIGRDELYVRFDQRLELELGITENLMGSLYFNLDLIKPTPSRSLETLYSISNEWKYKLLDNVADPIGLALYGEVLLSLQEIELEAKILLDKRVGPFLFAFNLVGEYEWEWLSGTVQRIVWLEGDLGATFLIAERFGIGLELHSESLIPTASGHVSTTLFAGPTLSYGTEHFFVVATFMPQLGSLKAPAIEAEFPGPLDLQDHERYMGRLLIGLHL